MENLNRSNNSLIGIPLETFQSNLQLRELDVSFKKELIIEVGHNLPLGKKKNLKKYKKISFEKKLHCTYGLTQIDKRYNVIDLKYTKQ